MMDPVQIKPSLVPPWNSRPSYDHRSAPRYRCQWRIYRRHKQPANQLSTPPAISFPIPIPISNPQIQQYVPLQKYTPPELSPSDDEGGGASDNRDFEKEVESFAVEIEVEVEVEVKVEVKVEGRPPRRKQLRESLKAAENTQQRKGDAPRKAQAQAPAKKRKPGKKALQAARDVAVAGCVRSAAQQICNIK